MKDPEILWPGQVRTIEAGFNFVHALFHLDRPTVTVVVRDDKTDLPFPQYSYMGRGVGWDANYIELRTGKRRQAMATLHRLDPKAAEEALVEAVTSAPTWTGFLFLLDDVRRRGWTEQAGELCDLLTRRAPPLAGLLEQALRSLPRKVAVMSRRRLLTERHQRTFLALLANLPDRSSIEHIVAALYPGSQPDRLVLEWITELASPDYRAISGLRLSEVQMTAIQAQLSGEMPDGTDRLESTLSDLVAGWEPKTTQCGLFGIPEHEEQLA
jgi:hypothetical protein